MVCGENWQSFITHGDKKVSKYSERINKNTVTQISSFQSSGLYFPGSNFYADDKCHQNFLTELFGNDNATTTNRYKKFPTEGVSAFSETFETVTTSAENFEKSELLSINISEVSYVNVEKYDSNLYFKNISRSYHNSSETLCENHSKVCYYDRDIENSHINFIRDNESWYINFENTPHCLDMNTPSQLSIDTGTYESDMVFRDCVCSEEIGKFKEIKQKYV